jgi:putative chitinase
MDLNKLKGHVPDTVIAQIPGVMDKFQINNPLRLAHFLAQCGHESGGFRLTKENLNYSAKGLMGIFKKYFPSEAKANEYARKPEKIANLVYASRMGNGAEASGDGAKYCGRGYIQLTGKDNYTNCSKFMFQDETLLENPDILLDAYYAIHSACWFWHKNNLNQYADSGDFVTMTKKINGGTIGIEDRKKHYAHAVDVLTGNH